MASVRELRRRVRAVQKTRQITRAMKMVATVRFKRAQEARGAAAPALAQMRELLNVLVSIPGAFRHPLGERRPVAAVGLVVVASERGLCGSFNSHLFRRVLRRVAAEVEAGRRVVLAVVGRKGREFFKRLPYHVGYSAAGVSPQLDHVEPLATYLEERFLSGEVDRWMVCYNAFKNVMQPRLTEDLLLPFEFQQAGSGETEFLTEPSLADVSGWTLPFALRVRLYEILLESQAAEQGIRMTMMDQATEKSGEVIHTLSIQMNKARQAAITKELIEITSAMEAARTG